MHSAAAIIAALAIVLLLFDCTGGERDPLDISFLESFSNLFYERFEHHLKKKCCANYGLT
jgi:hypothetical protein